MTTARPSRILVCGPVYVGDSVVMHSLLQRLKADEPAARIAVLAPPNLHGLVKLFPEVDEVIANPFGHGALRLGERYRLGRSLAGRFDRALVLPNRLKSALVPFFAGIPVRTGYIREGRIGLINDPRPLSETRMPRVVDQYNTLAEPRGTAWPRPALEPRLNVPAADRAAVLAKLGLDDPRPAVAFCVGSEGGLSKRWPAAHFVALAQRVAGLGRQVWLISAPGDEALGEEIVRLSGGAAVSLCGRTSMAEAVALLSAAEAVVSNDTGLMHVSAALGLPVVCLFGPTSPVYVPPLSSRAVVLSENLACAPCYKRTCPLGHNNCMKDLAPARAFETLKMLLGLTDNPARHDGETPQPGVAQRAVGAP